MKGKKSKGDNNTLSSKKGPKGIPAGHIAQDAQSESADDLIIGNMADLNEKDGSKKTLRKVIQMKRDIRKIKKEKAIISKLDAEDKEKAEHMLQVQKALRKSKGERIYDENSLKKRNQRILRKKNKSRKRWAEKLAKG
ncbi:conserved Plasmodium protein, unknown function [Plasmodium knowlesi strain H]|uniref:Ribosomal RNA-processing protein 14/surfeit locus protein 6 C-terminal domain-containing protein n=3 Tax=Plasmodium knowlesi TaxID=5850 RepID=A0A5K1UNC4_PLAKH|nr:conserved Plasmodium protein, unknown function [Plasmodium knowlesi strain H]OTN67490.1 Uncharacterized protein PKNOH_S06428900 [Plasmodium knowlesi]CAA9987560.1 conserved Plasmodium protein, unknown function [Plasmodium knowlesi strain H]SBO23059.1 conserved Plasmodium protein, unknown function [Plasmodium knowlesi strain H]SBO23711.1 conserved Plasmodium protein, unknown function [Plasmodium knowlesi strain H]VVS77034.1 conserved Plasmodium protein, unknown function [Plasmodium knowlesi s|eukprot:XP_002258561.1 hypothetical protein, conserved in Plasmodium species [Plasmodium knowlesi strain H]